MIWAVPPGIGPWITGDEITLPSSTTASWSCTEFTPYLLNICSVILPKAEPPAESKFRLVCQSTEVVDWVALADLMSLPRTCALSRTYLTRTPFTVPHDTVWMFGLLYCCAV